jgi:restriction system protein
MLPLLKIGTGGQEHHIRDVMATLAIQFGVTEEERKELLPSGIDHIFDNRVGWARTYLKKAGLIEYTKRGYFQITERGQQVLKEKPARIDAAFLRRFPEFVEFQTTRKTDAQIEADEKVQESSQTPEEAVAAGYQKLKEQVEADLLARVKSCPPEFFERLVVRLLTTMGYGGSLADAGKAIGKTGDGGVDGVIKEDRLGLELLYIQAKRWDSTTVGSPEIQKFVGALYGKKARKGIFITTSTFSKSAIDYAAGLDSKVILLDGASVSELMFEHGVGVTTVNNYEIKKVDNDFFDDAEVAAPATKAIGK